MSDATKNPLDTPEIRAACKLAGEQLMAMRQIWREDGVPEVLMDTLLVQAAANSIVRSGKTVLHWNAACQTAWMSALEHNGKTGQGGAA